MVNIVDIRAAGPPSHPTTRRAGRHRTTPDAASNQAAAADGSGTATRILSLHTPYRKTHRDLSCVRVIAASAIVAGLLLGTAPLALSQVGQLLASVPAAFAQVEQTPGELDTGAVDSPLDRAQADSIAQHRLGTHSAATSMISWTGTGQALRCSYGLLFEGNTRSCEAA